MSVQDCCKARYVPEGDFDVYLLLDIELFEHVVRLVSLLLELFMAIVSGESLSVVGHFRLSDRALGFFIGIRLFVVLLCT